MKQTDQLANATADKTRIKQAEARTQQAEARTEQARTRAELAETRTEQAESRTESAKTRTEQAEIRSEQAEAALQRVVHREVNLGRENRSLEQLTGRQRQILQLIAESQNTKQIAEILKVSPKTVEYHRLKLMDSLNVHDIASLVRFALKVGLIPPEN